MRIYLVEDEVYALRGLQQKILDLDGGYEIVGMAANGARALEEIPGLMPDVVLTDIRMPDMDGLELIERLRAEEDGILYVIVSGYQEFEYAKQAMRLDVQDYLLKPVQPAELEGCLASCAGRLGARDGSQNILSFLTGQGSIAEQLETREGEHYIAYIVIANPLGDPVNIIHPNVAYLSPKQMRAVWQGCLPGINGLHCVDGFFTNEKIAIFSAAQWDGADVAARLAAVAQELAAATGHYITLQYDCCRGTDSPAALVRGCRQNAVRNVRLGKTTVTMEKQYTDTPAAPPKEQIALLGRLLRDEDYVLLKSNLERMFRGWEQEETTLFAIQRSLVFLLNSLKALLPVRMEIDSLFCVENLACFSPDHTQLAQSFLGLLRELFGPQAEDKPVEGEELVRMIQEFYAQSLSENISLQMLSDRMGRSKVYLCRVFKKHTGMTPIDYFTHKKIERAEQLLLEQPDVPIREISDALGFNDMFYFSKVFKRVTGMPPSEMRAKKAGVT